MICAAENAAIITARGMRGIAGMKIQNITDARQTTMIVVMKRRNGNE